MVVIDELFALCRIVTNLCDECGVDGHIVRLDEAGNSVADACKRCVGAGHRQHFVLLWQVPAPDELEIANRELLEQAAAERERQLRDDQFGQVAQVTDEASAMGCGDNRRCDAATFP